MFILKGWLLSNIACPYLTYLLYHIFGGLSIVFLKFLKKIFCGVGIEYPQLMEIITANYKDLVLINTNTTEKWQASQSRVRRLVFNEGSHLAL